MLLTPLDTTILALTFGRDALNCVVAMIWQIPLWTIPFCVVFRDMRAILKFNCYDKLERESAPAASPAS